MQMPSGASPVQTLSSDKLSALQAAPYVDPYVEKTVQ